MSRTLSGFVAIASALVLAVGTGAAAHAVEYSDEPAFSYVPNGRVYAIATDGERVYIGGTFTTVDPDPGRPGSVRQSRLAAFDADTGELVEEWNPAIPDGGVRALAVSDGVVYAGGTFLNANGAPTTRLVALNAATGATVPGFTAAPGGEVRDLAVVGDDLFVAGSFGRVNGVARVGVAKLDKATGDLDRTWNARVGGGRVIALAKDDARGRLVIGGNFKTLAGTAQQFLGAVSYATAARVPWVPQRVCDTCNVLDLDVDGTNVFAATAGGGGGRAVAYTTSSNSRQWIKQGDGDVQAIDYHDGVVYIGGHFGVDLDNRVRHQVAALDPSAGGAVQSYAIPFTGSDDPGVWAVLADDSFLRIGGGFQGITGSPAKRYAVLPALAQ
jgi:hypothetical protein